MGKQGKLYTKEQKAEAVRLVLESDQSVNHVAKHLGIPGSTLGRWVTQAKTDSGEGTLNALTTGEKEELRRLRKENRRLRMETEFLKKAAAFFAKENGDVSK